LRFTLAAALLPLLAGSIPAQAREVRSHDVSDPEGRLLGFYASAVAFSGIGPGRVDGSWETVFGLELSYIPQLSRAERTAGSDKPESSNLTPLFPRFRIALTTPGQVRIEGGWVPPVRVFDARAHLYAIAVARPVATFGRVILTPRLAASGGRARGAITCYDGLADGGPDHALYFSAVCHGRQSDDHFDPLQLSAEISAARMPRAGSLTPYLGVGVRRDDIRFDIGVLHADGTRDQDQPILTVETTRGFVTAGLEWDAPRWPRLVGEVYYVPGSLITARMRIDAWTWRPRGQ
jgi:hypothetical protein